MGRRLCAWALVVAAVAGPRTADATPGDLDPTFGAGGKLAIDDPAGGNSVAFQPDGKMVVGGLGVLRLRADGWLDPAFGQNGRVASSEFRQVALAHDGKLLVAGLTGSPRLYLLLSRYLPDGTLDSSFGIFGIAPTVVGRAAGSFSLAIQPDGKIVTAGSVIGPDGGDFALMRHQSDGDLDATFGSGGFVRTTFDPIYSYDSAKAVLIRPDGRIVAAGTSSQPIGQIFALARYLSDGRLDRSFGDAGRVETVIGTGTVIGDVGEAAALQDDGKIVMVGRSFRETDGRSFIAVVRYRPGGQLDPSFGDGGKVRTALSEFKNEQGLAVAVDADGRIVVAGCSDCSYYRSDFVVLRYLADGRLDPAFGNGGFVKTDL